jgi:hypothetical protein
VGVHQNDLKRIRKEVSFTMRPARPGAKSECAYLAITFSLYR